MGMVIKQDSLFSSCDTIQEQSYYTKQGIKVTFVAITHTRLNIIDSHDVWKTTFQSNLHFFSGISERYLTAGASGSLHSLSVYYVCVW